MTKYWPNPLSPQWSRQAVITVSCHDLDDHKHKNGVTIDLFCTGVIGHLGYMFFKLGIEIPNLKQHNWSTTKV